MIVWGGWANTGYTNTGGRYNPVADTWQATTTINAPSARDGHTAVWTGTRMVVWGGIDNTGEYTNTGGRYYPIADTWLATSTTGAPSARASHTAVWTGSPASQMIVWGEVTVDGYTNTGGCYCVSPP